MKNHTKSKTFRFLAVFLSISMMLMVMPTPVAAAAQTGFGINIIGVLKNSEILVQAVNFPQNQTWSVRIGTYYGFRNDNVTVGTIDAPNGGTFEFAVKLPSVVKDANLISVRLDSQNKDTVYNAFYNVTRGSVPSFSSGSIEIPVTGTGGTQDTGNLACSMASITLTSPVIMPANTSFTTTWNVINTGNSNLNLHSIDYKYIDGTVLQQNGNLYDFPSTVTPGNSINLSVSMMSPAQSGIYTSNWAVVAGSTVICNIPVTIIVP